MSDDSQKDPARRVLAGTLSDLPTLNSRIVRVFISSTFTDFKEERNILMEDVYPKLKEYCKDKYGLEYQIADMRWGVTDEATDDHMTSHLCKHEIESCQRISTGPYFVTLLGQRHGFRSFPPIIAADEFEMLMQMKTDSTDTDEITSFFKKDLNAVPPVYILQPISHKFPEFLSLDKNKSASARKRWNEIHARISATLRSLANQCFDSQKIDNQTKHKYFMSVTEYEVQIGVNGQVNNPDDHCFSFIRLISDISDHISHEKAWRFIDMADCGIDTDAQNILINLRDMQVEKMLSSNNICRETVMWSEDGGINTRVHQSYLNCFAEKFYQFNVDKIERAMVNQQKNMNDQLYMEALQHLRMAEERCRSFQGREDVLQKVQRYFERDSRQPLVIYGQSGCGKTSVIAKTASRIGKWIGADKDLVFIMRFLGTSPLSSNILSLLSSLCQQIMVNYPDSDSQENDINYEDINEVITQFRELLSRSTATKPLFLFLDSLDQLSVDYFAHKLNWIPRELPENVYLVLSTLPKDYGILDICRKRVDFVNLVEVPLMTNALCHDILKSWLASSNRTLTEQQFNITTEAFNKCGLPLYVKLVFERVLQWKSYTPPSTCRLVFTVKAMINALFESVELKHGKRLVVHSLAYISASRNGLSETELEDLLSLDDEVLTDVFQYHLPPIRRIPPLLWVRIRHDIEHYIVTRLADDTRVSFWYHRQFIETAKERYLGDSKFASQIHGSIADYYNGIWYNREKPFQYTANQAKRMNKTSTDDKADRKVAHQPTKTGEGNDVKYNTRKLNQLPYHLFKADRITQLKDFCLFNYEWIYSKLKATTVQNLINDYELVSNDFECGIMKSVLSITKSSLSVFPSALAVEVTGRLLPYTLEKRNDCKYLSKLIDQCYSEGINNCALMPLQQCFPSPGGATIYSIEHPRIPTKSTLFCVSQTSNSAFILTNSNELMQWDIENGQLEKETVLYPPEHIKLNTLFESHDGKHIIIGGAFQKKVNPVIVVDRSTGDVIIARNLEKLFSKIGFTDDLQIDMTRGKDRILMNVSGKQCACFCLESGKVLHEFQVSSQNFQLTRNDDCVIFPIMKTNTVEVYDMGSYSLQKRLSFDMTPHTVVTAQSDMPLVLVTFRESPDIHALTLEPKIPQGTHIDKIVSTTNAKNEMVKCVCLSKDETLLLVTFQNSFIIFEVKKRYRILKSFTIPVQIDEAKHARVFNTYGLLDDKCTRLIAAYNRHLIVWNLRGGKLMGTLEVSKSIISKFSLTPDGQHVLVSTKNTNILQIVDLTKLNERYHTPLTLERSARYIDTPESSDKLAVRTDNPQETIVMSSETGEIISRPSAEYEVMQPYITPDGNYLVLMEYDSDEAIKVWSTESGRHVTSLPISTLRLKEYVVSENSKLVLTHCETTPKIDVDISVWDVSTGKRVIKLDVDTGGFSWMYFANNDQYVVALQQFMRGTFCQIQAFSLNTGKLIYTVERIKQETLHLLKDTSRFLAVQFDEDNASAKENLKIWDVPSGRELLNLDLTIERRVAISSDNHCIAHRGHIIDLRSGKTLTEFPVYGTKLVPRLTREGRHLVWLDFKNHTVQVGRVKDGQIIAVCPVHSAIMSIAVTQKDHVVLGCEDGRVMLMTVLDPIDSDIQTKLQRTRLLQIQSKTKSLNNYSTSVSTKKSSICVIL